MTVLGIAGDDEVLCYWGAENGEVSQATFSPVTLDIVRSGPVMVYHYCTLRQNPSGSLVRTDGLLTCRLPLDTVERFNDARRRIATTVGLEDISAFAITSLTLLNPHG